MSRYPDDGSSPLSSLGATPTPPASLASEAVDEDESAYEADSEPSSTASDAGEPSPRGKGIRIPDSPPRPTCGDDCCYCPGYGEYFPGSCFYDPNLDGPPSSFGAEFWTRQYAEFEPVPSDTDDDWEREESLLRFFDTSQITDLGSEPDMLRRLPSWRQKFFEGKQHFENDFERHGQQLRLRARPWEHTKSWWSYRRKTLFQGPNRILGVPSQTVVPSRRQIASQDERLCPFERLPSDVMVMIMELLPDLATIDAVTSASKMFHRAFIQHKHSLLYRVGFPELLEEMKEFAGYRCHPEHVQEKRFQKWKSNWIQRKIKNAEEFKWKYGQYGKPDTLLPSNLRKHHHWKGDY